MSDMICQVILDPPASGAWNMAVDAALLATAVEQKQCFLRWYRWSEPTLSLGYFQEIPQDLGAVSSLPVVRRLSGGGAIVHDDELTYSCVVPAGHPLAYDPQRLYTEVHESIAKVLNSWGFPVKPRGSTVSDRAAEFLCFGRGDAFDLVVGDVKVLGSAQRRRKGAVLQHGSLILRRSRFAPDFPGLLDLCPAGQLPKSDILLERMGTAVGSTFTTNLQFAALPESICQLASERP